VPTIFEEFGDQIIRACRLVIWKWSVHSYRFTWVLFGMGNARRFCANLSRLATLQLYGDVGDKPVTNNKGKLWLSQFDRSNGKSFDNGKRQKCGKCWEMLGNPRQWQHWRNLDWTIFGYIVLEQPSSHEFVCFLRNVFHGTYMQLFANFCPKQVRRTNVHRGGAQRNNTEI